MTETAALPVGVNPESRKNAFAFLRFALATTVIFAHSPPLGGFARDWLGFVSYGRWGLGSIAVFGFFFISGFLVTKSYVRLNSLPRFLWHRVLRIYPAFWVCLIITAFGFAGFAWIHDHSTLEGFIRPGDGPLAFLQNNWSLAIRQWGIDGLLAATPFATAFNGSLYTLEPEFHCYLGVALIGVFGLFVRARWAVVLIFLALWIPVTWGPIFDRFVPHRGLIAYLFPVISLLEMTVYFGIGALAYLFRDKIRLDYRLAILSLAVIAVTLQRPFFNVFVPFAFCYILFYLAFRAPIHAFDRFGDFSYGIYIYAFPVQQTLALLGFQRFGFWAFSIGSLLFTLPLAIVSWKLIEEPALRFKDSNFGALGRSYARLKERVRLAIAAKLPLARSDEPR
jgi:peptidoglycan/LPS O-acetylase OafA/YrhL